MKDFVIRTTLILLVICPLYLHSQIPGSLDPSFGDNGKLFFDNGFHDLYHHVMIQEDQKIIALGSSLDQAYQITAKVYRFLPDGTIDNTFATNGIFSFALNFEANLVNGVIRDDGKILLVGSTTDYNHYWTLLVQLNPEGVPDSEFGQNGVVVQRISPEMPFIEDFGYDVALLPDNRFIVAGKAHDENYNYRPYVALFLANGVLDNTFGTGGMSFIPVTENDNEFACLALQDDGKIMAAGHISTGLSSFALLAARFNPDGTPDNTFSGDGIMVYNSGAVDDEAFGLAINPDNKITITGFTASADYNYSMLMLQLDDSGNLNPEFGNQGVVVYDNGDYDVGYRAIVQEDHKILVAGTSGGLPPAGDCSIVVWRYLPDGTLDNSFGTSGMAELNFSPAVDEGMAMALQADGKIVVGGKSFQNTNLDFVIARLFNDIGISIPEVPDQPPAFISPNPVRSGYRAEIYHELNLSGRVMAEIFSQSGNCASLIDLGYHAKGTRILSFELPAALTDGMYFIRIAVDGVIKGKPQKLMIIR